MLRTSRVGSGRRARDGRRVRRHPYCAERILTPDQHTWPTWPAWPVPTTSVLRDGLGFHRGLQADSLTEPMRVPGPGRRLRRHDLGPPAPAEYPAAAASRQVRQAVRHQALVRSGRTARCSRRPATASEQAQLPPGHLAEHPFGGLSRQADICDGRSILSIGVRLLDCARSEVVVGCDSPEATSTSRRMPSSPTITRQAKAARRCAGADEADAGRASPSSSMPGTSTPEQVDPRQTAKAWPKRWRAGLDQVEPVRWSPVHDLE